MRFIRWFQFSPDRLLFLIGKPRVNPPPEHLDERAKIFADDPTTRHSS